MNTQVAEREVYFSDPRLKMTVVGRLMVRVIGYSSYVFLLAATLVLIFLKVDRLFYLGILLALFFLDYLWHTREADRPLFEMPSRGRVNLARYFNPDAFGVIEQALDRSLISKTNFTLEILRELLGVRNIKEGLLRMDVPPDEFEHKLADFLKDANVATTPEEREGWMLTLARAAFLGASKNGHKFIEPSDLFSALPALKDEYVGRLFEIFSISEGDLEKALIFSSLKSQFSRLRGLPTTLGGFVPGVHQRIRHRVINRAWTSRPTPNLDKYSLDLTDLARKEEVGFLVGHQSEYDRLEDVLARPVNPNALLVGEEGIGKETIVSHLAFQISKDKIPEALYDKRLVLLQISEVTAGAAQDELQARLKRIVDEIVAAGNIILYIPEFHNLTRTSGAAYLSAADALVPIIKNNAFPVIGATYPREFKEAVETRSDILGLFEVVRVNEVSQEEAEKILVYESMILERGSRILVSFGAIKKAVILAKKYFTSKFLPSSADELLKSAFSEAKRRGERVVGAEAVMRSVEERVNVPIREVGGDEAQELLNLESIIHERLINQEEAVVAVSNVLREYRSGLMKPGKPIASFLFVGPTGVGKTELSKILTEIMFGSKDSMVRFDMTEYQDKLSFYRFIGSPDGKITGALTDAILKKPYASILLDEFEKAYPDILDLFLQVFDDGRLTDNLGRTVDFQNTIIIATSNAHSDIINEAMRAGQKMSEIGEYLKRKLTDVFKPELLNRFSKIVVFDNLSKENVKKIAVLNLNEFSRNLREQGIFLEFGDSAVDMIARLGYDPAFGARPLQRVIDDKIKAPLAEKILRKEVIRGGKFKVDAEGEEIKIMKI